MTRPRILLLLALLVGVGCASAGTQGLGSSRHASSFAMDGASAGPKTTSLRAERTYDSKPGPRPDRSERAIQQLESAVRDVGHERGLRLEPDGKLDRLADFVLGAIDPSGDARPSATVVDAASRRVGLVEPVPFYSLFTLDEGKTLHGVLSESLDQAPASLRFNRFGVTARAWGPTMVYVVMLSSVGLDLEPIRRRFDVGQSVRLRGALRDPYANPRLDVTAPAGGVRHVDQSKGRPFDFLLRLAGVGVHKVELLAEGPYGVEVIANFPLFVGVDEPDPGASRTHVPAGSTDASAGVAAIGERLLDLLNRARAEAGVPTVARDEALSRVAEAHSRDMVDHGFFGHTSPTAGDAAARARRSGIDFAVIAENLGRGSTAEEVHAMLLDSPGHRANALHTDWSAVGIGVVVDPRGSQAKMTATYEFVSLGKPIDIPTARAELISAIQKRRAAAGAAKVEIDPILDRMASAAAARSAADPGQSQPKLLEQLDREIATAAAQPHSPLRRLHSTQSTAILVSSIEQVPLDRALDPAVRYVGIGVGQARKPGSGAMTIAVFLTVAWPR